MKYVRIDRNGEHCGGVLEGETVRYPFRRACRVRPMKPGMWWRSRVESIGTLRNHVV